MSIWSKISVIVTIICLAWCTGLIVFVIVKKLIEKFKARKEVKSYDAKKKKRTIKN